MFGLGGARIATAVLFILAAKMPASAQECVSCRSKRCSAMSWVPPCTDSKPKPVAAPADVPKKEPHTKCAALKLDVDFPPKISEGDLIGIRIRSNCRAYLVVYYLEDKGAGAVLWPSDIEKAPLVSPERPASLLSSREAEAGRAIQAQLRAPGQPASETIIVFGLTERADFDRLRPKPGTQAPDGEAFTAALKKKLAALPAEHWNEFVARYTIEPAKQ
jgi:hypothetical protein